MENYLIHYGIKGQQWGKQNGPPYPLSDQQKSIEERRNAKIRPFTKASDLTEAEKRKRIAINDFLKKYNGIVEGVEIAGSLIVASEAAATAFINPMLSTALTSIALSGTADAIIRDIARRAHKKRSDNAYKALK